MSKIPRKPRWYQFTILRLMITTSLLAIWCGALVRLIVGAQDRSLTRGHGWLLLFVAVVSACLAIGSLFQRALVAAIIGASAVLILWGVSRNVFWASY